MVPEHRGCGEIDGGDPPSQLPPPAPGYGLAVTVTPGWPVASAIALLVALTVGAYAVGRLPGILGTVVAAARALGQLSLAALVITAVIDNLALSLLVLALMFTVAVVTTVRRVGAPSAWLWATVAMLVVAVVVIRILPIVRSSWRDGIPLLAYAAVVGGMAALAWATGLPVVGIGATLFLLSDGVIAYNRFVREVSWAHLVVHITYHLGQLLIVLGMLRS